jgi:hypothetical protein
VADSKKQISVRIRINVSHCIGDKVSHFSSDNVSVEIYAYLGARMSRNDPNPEVDIGRDNGFTFIEFLDIIHRPVFFYKKRKVLETEFCLCLQVNTCSVGPNRYI